MKNILKDYYHKINKNYQNIYLLKKEMTYFEKVNRILDVGCGIGEFIELDSKRVMGIDSNKESISFCRKKKLPVKIGDATKIPYKDNTFDGVHCAHVIEHLMPKDAFRLLKEVSRVLKKGGILVISSPIFWEGFYNDFTHIKPYYPDSILRYLENRGEQRTLSTIKYTYKKLDLYWRYQVIKFPGRLGYLLGNFLYQYGIHRFKKDGYTLVMIKE